ncbi:hypothetical protein Ocin01_00955 [Orchesella cincta]|uniref:Uncharacterized protein n=1 Tax=Orchesella cincta TaxID=48709 RepID=A0A1D2NKI3_ORCCI|nr:hypothetical protein Ocin01_00955 [Orchesella cincta]
MWRWPPSDQLMEQMLNSMGYQIPARKQVIELTKMKQSLQLKLKLLLKKRGRLIEKLDEFEDSAARYELLDQDEILPPIPENSSLNLDLMHAIFKNMQFIGSSRDDEGVDLVVALPKPDPITYVLPIQYHDKRMLS